MNQLSLRSYGWKCVLGAEVSYVLCLLGGLIPWRTEAGVALHHALFETMPGFVWIDTKSVIIGAVYMFAFAWIFAWYMVWMYNSSLERK